MFHLRVNYDVTTWGLIGNQLSRDHLAIPALQRATIICDVADLARTGYVLQVIREQIYIFGKTQETMAMVLAYRELEEEFGPLLAFKECVDSKGSDGHEKDLAF